jgi:hypothetical protein
MKVKNYKTASAFYPEKAYNENNNKNSHTTQPTEDILHHAPSIINMKYEKSSLNLSNPKVWGPSFWFTLHNGSLNYPIKASPIIINKMKGFINGIPYMLPCKDCAEHARVYIHNNQHTLNDVCKTRDTLFCFYVDFHNYVNERYGKPIMSCDDAKKLYSKDTLVKMNYK